MLAHKAPFWLAHERSAQSMKQKMSRASGVDCAAAAFANDRGLSCSPASRFCEWPWAELV
ncbi:hypothetical protein WAL18_05850 [Waltera acetigignens]